MILIKAIVEKKRRKLWSHARAKSEVEIIEVERETWNEVVLSSKEVTLCMYCRPRVVHEAGNLCCAMAEIWLASHKMSGGNNNLKIKSSNDNQRIIFLSENVESQTISIILLQYRMFLRVGEEENYLTRK